MKGWILDKRDRWNEYEHYRFREEARKEDVYIQVRLSGYPVATAVPENVQNSIWSAEEAILTPS